MVPAKERVGYFKQLTSWVKGESDSFTYRVKEQVKWAILQVLPDPLLALHDDLLMTGQAVLEQIHQVLHCLEHQHGKEILADVSGILVHCTFFLTLNIYFHKTCTIFHVASYQTFRV